MDNDQKEKHFFDNRHFAYSNRIASLIRRITKVSKVLKVNKKLVIAGRDFGETVSPLIPNWTVKLLYFISLGYIAYDISLKTYESRENGRKSMMLTFIDTTIWHSLASFFLPAVSIHHIVEGSSHFIQKTRLNDRMKRLAPICLGFISIPMLISPLDKLTDFSMNKTIRRAYKDQIKIHPHE